MNGKAETLLDFLSLLSQSDAELATAWRAYIGAILPKLCRGPCWPAFWLIGFRPYGMEI